MGRNRIRRSAETNIDNNNIFHLNPTQCKIVKTIGNRQRISNRSLYEKLKLPRTTLIYNIKPLVMFDIINEDKQIGKRGKPIFYSMSKEIKGEYKVEQKRQEETTEIQKEEKC